MHFGLVAKPTRFPVIEKLPIARRTVDYMVPLLILLDVLEPRGSGREVSQNIRAGAAMPFWVGVRGLYRRLVFVLQAIPLLFRCFAFHVCQSVIMA
jgi:hypothetical protein